MSKNRPKIWLDDTTYIYRSEYNICSNYVQWYPDTIQSCRKFKTVCDIDNKKVQKGDSITAKLHYGVDFRGLDEWILVSGRVARIDFNYHNQPDELQIQTVNGSLYTFHFRTKDTIIW